MALPAGFSSVEHFKSVAIKTYNAIVREEFSDINDDIDDDIKVPRKSLRKACLVTSQDSQILINNRMMLLFFVLRKAQDLQAPIYGIPTGTYNETFKYKPHVCLYFYQDRGTTEEDFQPIRTQISFRLMNETETSITNGKLTTIANKIKTQFGTGNGYKFKRGRTMLNYHDLENGYRLKLFIDSEQEGKEIVKKMLSLTDTAFNPKFLNVSYNDSESTAYPSTPPTRTILGKTVKLPRKRAIGFVKFSHATCAIWGMTKPVLLYSRTGILNGGLVD